MSPLALLVADASGGLTRTAASAAAANRRHRRAHLDADVRRALVSLVRCSLRVSKRVVSLRCSVSG